HNNHLCHGNSSTLVLRNRIILQLQIISVLQWVITFLVMGAACALILLYIGRHPEWVRNWTVWKHFRDYFPIRLIKTHTFLLIRNYIFEYHPHGIVYFGAFCNSGTEATGFSKKIPGICPHLATLSGNFRLPLPQDYLLSGGICPVNRKAIDYIFSKSGTGNSVGGAAESLDCTPGKNIVTLKNRKGFVKLALQQGADWVAVYSFGENEVYKQIILKKFHGRGMFSANTWGIVPYSKSINTGEANLTVNNKILLCY
uniref:Diacylglycerol O-acyltransferase 2 n=1 Tax=Erpetoichthys calabaricus TaxID=27687 RepID=A0A8C4RM97_ERPCA